ncbi:hypothetical protein BDR03DRAFT_178346 [Suillus americanus]|nr:hypothetical protein BDR03DRAFT_178346 [Suillus americanus]
MLQLSSKLDNNQGTNNCRSKLSSMLLAAVLNSFTAMVIPSLCSKLGIYGSISNLSHLLSRCISRSSLSRNRSTLAMSHLKSDFCIYFFVPSTRTRRGLK